MLVCIFFLRLAHETAGAARTRSSLRPLFQEREIEESSGDPRREIAKVSS